MNSIKIFIGLLIFFVSAPLLIINPWRNLEPPELPEPFHVPPRYLGPAIYIMDKNIKDINVYKSLERWVKTNCDWYQYTYNCCVLCDEYGANPHRVIDACLMSGVYYDGPSFPWYHMFIMWYHGGVLQVDLVGPIEAMLD